MMDATNILLKCLKSKRYINDIETARKDVKTDTIVLKKDADLFIRDAITGIGTILKEDLENHYYITTVKIGVLNNILTQAIIMRNEGKAEIAVYAHEGLIKQHLADKSIHKLKNVLS